jgi:hypothetical protein
MPGRSGEMMWILSSRAVVSVNCAIVRELGQPWQNITGVPVGSPYSSKAIWPPFSSWISLSPIFYYADAFSALVLQAPNL